MSDPPSLAASEYCTQACLLGLRNGTSLDRSCPNVEAHGDKTDHAIDLDTFKSLMRRQLREGTNGEPMEDAESSWASILKFRLSSHGYVVVAKTASSQYAHRISHEARVYEQLATVQGIHVPVSLGEIYHVNLLKPACVEFDQCMLLLSFAGKPITGYTGSEPSSTPMNILREAKEAVSAIHNLGVLHRSLAYRNVLLYGVTERPCVIDFHRSAYKREKSVDISAAIATEYEEFCKDLLLLPWAHDETQESPSIETSQSTEER